jgi:hypothetical protein
MSCSILELRRAFKHDAQYEYLLALCHFIISSGINDGSSLATTPGLCDQRRASRLPPATTRPHASTSRTRPNRDRRHGLFGKSSPTRSRRRQRRCFTYRVEHSGFQSLRAAGTRRKDADLTDCCFPTRSSRPQGQIHAISPTLDPRYNTHNHKTTREADHGNP